MTPETLNEPAAGQQTQHWTPRLQAQLTHFWKVGRIAIDIATSLGLRSASEPARTRHSCCLAMCQD